MFRLVAGSVAIVDALPETVSWETSAQILNLVGADIAFCTDEDPRAFQDCLPMPFYLGYASAIYDQFVTQGAAPTKFLLPDCSALWEIRLADGGMTFRPECQDKVYLVETGRVLNDLVAAMSCLYRVYDDAFPDHPEVVTITHTIGMVRGSGALSPHFALNK